MSDILQEVLNDQSDERKLYYFRKALPIVIIFTILSAVAIFIYDKYRTKEDECNMKVSETLINSINIVDSAQRLKSIDDLITSESSKSKVIEVALLEQINLLVSSKKYQEAKDTISRIVENNNSQELTSSYAKLIWLTLVMDKTDLSKEDIVITEKYLEYFNDPNRMFFANATILKAYWYLNRNQKELALEILQKAQFSKNIPLIIKEQIKSLLSKIK